MLRLCLAALFALIATPAFAAMPVFNTYQHCTIAAGPTGANGRAVFETCMDLEKGRQKEALSLWRNLSSAGQTQCEDMSRRDNNQSYIALLGCIRMVETAEKIGSDVTNLP